MGNEPHAATQAQLSRSVIVIGGGLAGMSAAWRLVEAGCCVTLVERRPYLGGRAYSFVDADTGETIDNGQHVFMACCTAYTDFLNAIGTLDMMARQRALHVEVRDREGRVGALGAAPLPPPLHLLPSFIRYPHLGLRDKLRAVPALLRIQRERDRNRPALREQSFEQWLRANGQSERAVANFWDLVIVPTLNDASRDVAASMGFLVFQVGLLSGRHSADIGFARAGLSDAMGSAVERQLQARGARLLLGRSISRLKAEGGRVAAVELAGGEEVRADWYISALPPYALEAALDTPFPGVATHEYAPIVNLHVWYDRPVADFEWSAFVDSPLQYVFNRSRIANLRGPGQYLTVSLSGAWDYWPLGKEELRRMFTDELAAVLPKAREAKVERFAIVKEQRATFRSPPSGPENRLPVQSPLPNLLLAGDWTDTGWPATMEGAVRSGNAAAEAIISAQRGQV